MIEWSPCDSGGCVQTATDNGFVLVRSSLRPDEVARFTEEEWAAHEAKLRREGWAEAIAALRAEAGRMNEMSPRQWAYDTVASLWTGAADYLESLTPEAGQ